MRACLKFVHLFKNNNWTFAERISIKWYPLILLIVPVLSIIILTILLQAYYNLVISKNSAVINIAHENMLKNEK